MIFLTKPTRRRLALWIGLALLWLLFLPQELAMDPHLRHLSWAGAIFWALVLAWIVTCGWITRKRLRDASAR
jgi:uncharacterized membrane protein